MRKSFGIDVGKNELVYCYRQGGITGKCSNTMEGRIKLIELIKPLMVDIVVFENTGPYHRDLSIYLCTENIPFLIANPKRVRDFAKGMGKLAKTDNIDSEIISWYGELTEESPTKLVSKKQQDLKDLASRRAQLMDFRVQEKNRLSELAKSAAKGIRASLVKSLKSVKVQLTSIDGAISKIIAEDDGLSKKAKDLSSAKGVADVTSAVVLATLPEIGTLGKRQITSLVGLAPFDNSSGNFKGKKSIYGGRAVVRSSLYMATLSATRYNPPIRAMYKRLLAKGKPKKVALVACMRKLLITLNAMIRDGAEWNPAGVPWPK